LAAKFGRPVICFIDTPGAYPGVAAEERGQSQVIAESMFLMSRLPTPDRLRGDREGGSGGRCNRRGRQNRGARHAYYSVISPKVAPDLGKAIHTGAGRKALN